MDTIHLNDPRVKMVAHRGVSGLERENTCAAFVAAGNRSYFGVETDIHRTTDGAFVVYHDDHTSRLTEVDLVVEECTLEQLRALRLKDMDDQVRGDLCLPTLEEYVRICKKYDKTCVLELKNHFEPKDVEKVIEIIRGLDWLEKTVFISFDLPNMLCIRQLLPEQKAQYLVSQIADDLLDILRDNRLDLDIYYKSLTKDFVRAVHAIGQEVNVWTVNTLEEAQTMAEMGVDFITTNIVE